MIKRLLLALALFIDPVLATVTQITGSLVDSAGNGVSGTACFRLPVNAIDTSLNRALSPLPVCFPVTNGTFPAFANLTPNDVIQPANTYYQVTVRNSSGALVFSANYVIPTGAGTFNIGLAIPTVVTTSNISFLNPPGLGLVNSFTNTNNFNAGAGNADIRAGDINEKRYACSLSVAYKFQTLGAAYADLPSTGGTVEVCPGHSETLTANLVLSKSYAGFQFTGPATITMGTFQVTKASGIHGAFIKGPAVPGTQVNGSALVKFAYTGTGNALAMGDSSADTKGLTIEYIDIDTGGGGANAIGLYITRTQNFFLNHVVTYCGSTAQVGITLDGTGNFTGDSVILNPYALACFSGIRLTGSGTGAGNDNVVSGGVLFATAAGGRALDFQDGAGNTVTNIDIEGAATAINFASNANVTGNVVSFWNAVNTTDVAFGALSSNNQVTALTGNPVATGLPGNANRVIWPGNFYNTASASTAASIAATTMVTPATATTYRFTAYPTLTVIGTSCTGTTTLALSAIYTDPNESVSNTTTLAAVNLAITGNGTVGHLPGGAANFAPLFLRAKANTPVQYSTTYTLGTGCSPGPSYQIFPALEPVN